MSFVKADGHVTDDFAQVMVDLAEAWGARISERRIRIYAKALSDLTLDQVLAGSTRAVKESGFFPSIAELRKASTAGADDAGVLAWVSLERAASEFGAYESVEVGDGCAGRALAYVFGSWAAFCAMEAGPELHRKRQEFLAAYRVLRATAASKVKPVTLPGTCAETGNYRQGKVRCCVLPSGATRFLPAGAEPKRLKEGTP